MDITEETRGGVTIVKPIGRIDSATSAEFETRLVEAVVGRGKASVVVDMTALTYISSAGLRALLVAAKKAKPTGSRVVLAAMAPTIREVFDMSGFSALFEIHAAPDAAVAALS
jgi:anti-sigma B factor antagonist